jgi:hypothetical protein
MIDIENNKLENAGSEGLLKLLANFFIIIMLGLTIYLMIKK